MTSPKFQFIGREKEIEQFLQYLTQSPETPQPPLLINIHGQSGMGKTFLLQQFRHLALESGNLSVYLDGDEADILTMMGKVVKKLEQIDTNLGNIEEHILKHFPTFSNFIPPLKKLSSANPQLLIDQFFKKFNDKYKLYLQCLEKIDNDPEKPQGLSNSLGKTTAKLVWGAAKEVPVLGTALKYLPGEALTKQAGEWAEYIEKKFSQKDKRSLMYDPRGILTPLFLEGLKKLTQEKLVVICFDDYERIKENLGKWLRNCFDEDYGKLPQNLIFTIAGRKELNLFQWANYEDKIERICLPPFTKLEAKKYLENKGITEEVKVNKILNLSGKTPLLIHILTVIYLNNPHQNIDISDDFVDYLLQWVEDEKRKDLALLGTIPRSFNRDILTVLVGEEEAKAHFDWLSEMPFVVRKPALIRNNQTFWAYYSVVRELMSLHKRQESPHEWASLQGKLAESYENWAKNLGLTEDKAIDDTTWQSYQLEAMYHRLCQSPQQALIPAFQQFINIFHHHRDLASFWAETVSEAGETTGNEVVLRWGKLLVEGITAFDTAPHKDAIKLFTTLLREITDKQQQALLHFWRGEAYRRQENEDRGIEDYNRAIAFYNELGDEEQLAVTIAHRGIASMQKGDDDQAMADLNQATALQPDYLFFNN